MPDHVSAHQLPEPGQLVHVRARRFVVVETAETQIPADELSPSSRPVHLVTLSSVDDDGVGEKIHVVWEIEPGAVSVERNALPGPTGFDTPDRFDAFLNAVRWGAVSASDTRSLQAPFRSGIEIEDYQLDPVVRALKMPRVNLLIADDVGLGKTIESGLVIQELLVRHRARNVLVVCPSGLQIQWRDQMRDKFGLEFRIVDAETVRTLRRERGLHVNPWNHFPRLITSIDYIKREVPLRRFRELVPPEGQPPYPRRFDLLIVDEAHNVAPSGTGRYAIDSQRTAAIRVLSPHFEHKLFLSATPHNGYRESFTALLELLDNQRFARTIDPDKAQLQAVMVRRLKSELKRRWDGSRRFADRRISPIEVEWTVEERQAHADLQAYTRSRRELATSAQERCATEFVLKLLKKRLFSSPAAFLATLEKHRQTINAAGGAGSLSAAALQREFSLVEDEDVADELADEAEDAALVVAARHSSPLTEAERVLLGRLHKFAERAAERPDSKAKQLLHWLDTTLRPEGEWGRERVIIFTEYRRTQDYLHDILAGRGMAADGRLMLLYGGIDKEDREKIKAAFQTDPDKSEVRILLATDAASEGIDLQNHCSRLIHYEIPWNPTRLEQRNGRIDRHGQRADEVLIHHFVSQGYQEEVEGMSAPGDLDGDLEFLMRAVAKVERIREDLGKVGPVIAQQVERAMLKADIRRLDTAAAESDAEATRRMLRFKRDLEAEVTRLKEQLDETRRELNLNPDEVASVVRHALDLAHQPQLMPTTLEDTRGPVYRVPELRLAWAEARIGLEHPHTREERPITFDPPVAAGRDDVVLAHLNHRLVQMSLQLLRAEVWKLDDRAIHRVTARLVPNDVLDAPAVVGYGRLVILGGDRHRLREEVIVAGGRIEEGRKLSRLTQDQLARAVGAAMAELPSEQMRYSLAEVWPRIKDGLWRLLETRKTETTRNIESQMTEAADVEVKRMRAILTELSRQIREELKEEPEQLAFDFVEREQLKRDRDALRLRLDQIPGEMEREEEGLRRRYSNPTAYLFPVGICFLVPVRYDR